MVKTGVMEKARQPYTNTPNLLKTGFTRWLPHLMSQLDEYYHRKRN